ncbi:2Fe-2S iron-sulfur cluster-binding protein [Chitinibacter tainanensis]|uniref:2Fe-2S iron-sulfur cluster-binding protein n=1 Tax=Chitinibacter tainanensis TaxID=230667 RepID=UPI0003FDFC1F|nr:2Fe-2S iron-sulfur cluster binding domain-containing protein [Chitinibacter tainanensis]
MPQVQFIWPELAPLSVEVPAGTLLIEVARELTRAGHLPLAWRCGQGTCGTCQIYIAHAASGGWISLSGKERNVLVRHARMPLNLPLTILDTPQQVRLACHYRVEYDVCVYPQPLPIQGIRLQANQNNEDLPIPPID